MSGEMRFHLETKAEEYVEGGMTLVLRSLLFGVSETDLLTFAGVSLLLALVAFLACLISASSATKVGPMVALRHE
jgi:ABC-type lipoprotein release transport system permease subunit